MTARVMEFIGNPTLPTGGVAGLMFGFVGCGGSPVSEEYCHAENANDERVWGNSMLDG